MRYFNSVNWNVSYSVVKYNCTINTSDKNVFEIY